MACRASKNTKINKKGAIKMTNENGFDLEEMTNEELAEYYLQEAVESAQITLQLSESCYRKFGEQLLTDTQKAYMQKMASGVIPTDEEQAAMKSELITLDVQGAIRARGAAKQASAQIGEAYTPELVFQDRTDESVN
jgi:transcriptional regulator of aromatic amino acid metabolism